MVPQTQQQHLYPTIPHWQQTDSHHYHSPRTQNVAPPRKKSMAVGALKGDIAEDRYVFYTQLKHRYPFFISIFGFFNHKQLVGDYAVTINDTPHV